jgi:hypothetical protein
MRHSIAAAVAPLLLAAAVPDSAQQSPYVGAGHAPAAPPGR